MQLSQEVVAVAEWIQQSNERSRALMLRELSLQGWTNDRAERVITRAGLNSQLSALQTARSK